MFPEKNESSHGTDSRHRRLLHFTPTPHPSPNSLHPHFLAGGGQQLNKPCCTPSSHPEPWPSPGGPAEGTGDRGACVWVQPKCRWDMEGTWPLPAAKGVGKAGCINRERNKPELTTWNLRFVF